MRFATFSRGGDPEVGAVWPSEGLIRPLRDGPLAFRGDMSNLAESYDKLSVDLISRGTALKLSEVRLLAPISNATSQCLLRRQELQGTREGVQPERLRCKCHRNTRSADHLYEIPRQRNRTSGGHLESFRVDPES